MSEVAVDCDALDPYRYLKKQSRSESITLKFAIYRFIIRVILLFMAGRLWSSSRSLYVRKQNTVSE